MYASIESLAYLASRKPVVWTFHRFWGITGGCDHPGDCRRYLDACGNCPRVNEWPICGVDNTAAQLALKLQRITNAPLHIVSPSRHLADKVAGSPVGKQWQITHIPNGVNPLSFGFERKHDPQFRRLLGIDPDATAVLIVNRDFKDPVKGYRTIATALARLKPDKAQFIFAGGNSAWAIGNLGGGLSCIDMGYVSSRQRMAELYEAADIFLYSSPGENFPCAIIEAMSAKCCVVSTPTDGVIEQVQNNASGIVSSSFSGEDLAKALEFALASPEKCRAYADAARQRVEAEFSERQMIETHFALYRKLISTTG
jgi:glycosyltransferase involved in cell wall biosynthesis